MSVTSKSKHFKSILMPILVVIVAGLLAKFILANPPEVKKRSGPQQVNLVVKTQSVQLQPYQVNLESFGVVQPRTQTSLIAQASGQITAISPQFRDGGFFEKGEVLVSLDDRDHKADVKIARANLLDAKQSLAEEQARSQQARDDWQNLGKTHTPRDLVLRKPQLEAAKARLLAAEAQLEKASLALERTQITAPYAGRVQQKRVDVGQVVTNNTLLADVYAVDWLEVRLPINNQSLSLIDLPEQHTLKNQALVSFSSSIFPKQHWQGTLVRTEGAIDSVSQRLFVVAQIADPYKNPQSAPIKIGQYVNASITAKQLEQAIVIPVKAIYQGSYVYLVKEGLLTRQPIVMQWKNDTEALIASGLKQGDQLVLTPLGQVSSGTQVKVEGQTQKQRAKRKGDDTETAS